MTDIALICPASGRWHDLAIHILTPLGLPQVNAFRESDTVPSSVHTRIAFGPETWELGTGNVDTWRFTCNGVAYQPQTADETGLRLPTGRLLTYVKSPGRNDENRHDEIDALEQALFWSKERLLKGSCQIESTEVLEWMLFLHIASIRSNMQGELYNSIKDALSRRAKGCIRHIENFFVNGSSANGRESERYQIEAIAGLYGEIIKESNRGKFWSSKTLTQKIAFKSPVLIVARQLITSFGDKRETEADTKFLHKYLRRSSNALRLAALEITARMSDREDLANRVSDIFRSPAWQLDHSLIPRMNPQKKALCFSPMIVLRFYLLIRDLDPDYFIPAEAGCEWRSQTQVSWKSIDTEVTNRSGLNTPFFSEKSKLISRSLIDNWVKFHSAPCSTGFQYKLKKDNYRLDIKILEDVWISLFVLIQTSKNLTLLQLLPWPFGKTAALSLRYDVDRPISAVQIENITRIQQDFFHTSAASWYYFPADANLPTQRQSLVDSGQEIGLHVECITPDVNGLGVTHHSAATSDYWRGDLTIEELENHAARYGEFLANQLSIPRPAWISKHCDQDSDEVLNGKIGNTWLIPIAFPLEGSTSDTSLDYFDRLRLYFAEQLATGGYAIICSHPDLNQKILEQLLEKTSLAAVWAAPTEKVVSRCQDVLQKGNVKIGSFGGDNLALSSQVAIGRLSIRAFVPGASKPAHLGVDLEPGIKMELDFQDLQNI